MQTRLSQSVLDSAAGREADDILRRCVHCGFCNATCPTFRLTGNELEGPRGRIYLVKGLLEGDEPSRRTLGHLDHCLSCRACETTCPSGVNFHRLADIGRERLAEHTLRPWWDRSRRRLLARFLGGSLAFRGAVAVARALRPILPRSMGRRLPATRAEAWPAADSGSQPYVLLHQGCVQPTLAPSIDAAAARVLHRRGISARPAEGCCGAMAYHLDDLEHARQQIRRNIDGWLPVLEKSEGLVVTASGCAAFVRDYGRLCQDDPLYAERGEYVSSRLTDVCDFLQPRPSTDGAPGPEVILHVPCTLKNALRGEERLRRLLTESGWRLARTSDDGQCCGSAGAYSLLHPQTSQQLLRQKLDRLQPEEAAQEIVTANLGCGMHLAAGTSRPVRHWLEVWDRLEA